MESQDLTIIKYLNNRMQLPSTNQTYYRRNKGFEGELLFDEWLKTLECDCLVLNDLLFNVNNQKFQIDSLLISNNQISVFEVKNYEGDYLYKSDRMLKDMRTDAERTNPLIQLNRTDSLFRQVLQQLNNTMSVHFWVIFINPEFTLYQAPIDKPIILPTQLNRFRQNFNSIKSKINQTHKNLAEKLNSLIVEENPYTQIPSYTYQSLQKGVTCSSCHSFSIKIQQRKCICMQCGYEEKVDTAVVRSVEEFKLLFPDERVTTNTIFDWCGIITPKRKIQRILNKNFTKVGVHQWMYYE